MIKSTFVCAAILLLSTQSFADEGADRAMLLLKNATTTLQTAETISVTAQATVDEIEPMDDFKLQKNFSMEVTFKRPDRLHVVRSGDENQIGYFDGKMLTVIDPKGKKYGQEALVGTVDDLLLRLEKLNVQAPLADLLQSNLVEVAQKAVLKARYLGVNRVGSQDCEHVAFRTSVADWQLWISQGKEATLCKSIITTRGVAQAPQYEVTFSSWKINAPIDESSFVAIIPSGLTEVPFGPGVFNFTR